MGCSNSKKPTESVVDVPSKVVEKNEAKSHVPVLSVPTNRNADELSKEESKLVAPYSGFVIKTKIIGSEEKVFLNLGYIDVKQEYSNVREVIAFAEKSHCQDKNLQQCTVYGAALPTEIFHTVQQDKSCSWILEFVNKKYDINLDKENLSFPNIQRGFIGDGITDVLVDCKYIPLQSNESVINTTADAKDENLEVSLVPANGKSETDENVQPESAKQPDDDIHPTASPNPVESSIVPSPITPPTEDAAPVAVAEEPPAPPTPEPAEAVAAPLPPAEIEVIPVAVSSAPSHETDPTTTPKPEAAAPEPAPVESRASESAPAATIPSEAAPVETTPPEAAPIDSQPPESAPVESRPSVVVPFEITTSESAPMESEAAAPAAKEDADSPEAPLLLRGWLKKQGHKVLNWKSRYFVLDNGLLSYYVEQKSTAPFGDILKGQLCLAGYLVKSTEDLQEQVHKERSKSVVSTLALQFSAKPAATKLTQILLQQGPNKELIAFASQWSDIPQPPEILYIVADTVAVKDAWTAALHAHIKYIDEKLAKEMMSRK
eukprot:CAMPEP_0201110460 /NCGR_PEP_ID=MMETSP0812-20130820/70431_1 /ASSEMBLY_ACC=CAM_ASM_000668 /TAXON_ID=98059 /ORGANISM="Dinobryon sp., Strain UTEXLB2267" /LENGTH=545 /DNA_ID=CAMNT_0047372899 /DNA_START=6 /DNA_END=1643 /DNA_ORIENTATION=+